MSNEIFPTKDSLTADELRDRAKRILANNPLERQDKLEISGDLDDSFVTALKGIKDLIGIKPDASVIYPGSSTHVGVARVFGKEAVTHVDPDERVKVALEESGYRGVTSGIEQYVPDEPVDVIVALNSYGKPDADIISRLVKPGGWIIANNYTGWARDVNTVPGLELKAAVLPTYMDSNRQLLQGDEIPPDATEDVAYYMKMSPEGKITPGTVQDHTISDVSARYPDGLFAFQFNGEIQ